MHIAHKNDCMQITKFMLLLCSLHSHTLTQIDEWSLARDTFWENERKIESGWKQWQAAMHLNKRHTNTQARHSTQISRK